LRGNGRFEVRGPVLDDCVVSEDPVFRLVDPDESEELFLRFGELEYSSPIEASCRVSVGWNCSSCVGLDNVVARLRPVALDSVTVLLTPLRPLPNVVAPVDKIDGGIFDREDVGMGSAEVEDVESTLESFVEADDGVVVDSIVLVIFLYDFEPTRCYSGDEVGEFVDIDVVGLCVSQEKSLAICTGYAGHGDFDLLRF